MYLEQEKIKVAFRDEMALKEPEFSITIGNTEYKERADGGTALISAISKAKTGVRTEVGKYKGFSISIEKNFMGVNYLILSGKTDYTMEPSTSPVGIIMRLENAMGSIHEKVGFLEQKLEEYHRSMEQAKADFAKPFEHEEELKAKLARQYEINAQLDLDRGQDDVTDMAQDDELVRDEESVRNEEMIQAEIAEQDKSMAETNLTERDRLMTETDFTERDRLMVETDSTERDRSIAEANFTEQDEPMPQNLERDGLSIVAERRNDYPGRSR